MTRPRNYQTEAVIIKKTKLGEADRILTFYTPNLGKIQAVAKGVRRPRSKMAGHLELLTHSLVSLARGRNLDTVTGSQTIDGFFPLKSDLELISYALYIVELVEQFTADHDENRPLFELLLKTMHCLCQETDRELTLRYFELRLLDLAGYRPQLGQCVSCHQSLKPETNFFSPRAGGVLCPGCQRSQPPAHPLSVDALKVLRWLQGSDEGAAGRLRINRLLSRELETVMRAYLRYLLEREVRSTVWLDTLREQTRPQRIAEEEKEG
ncbi:MAG TPA: DNA repair protein RecO [Dehalococcoidia bacterium]|nr:DNA repair protein RecO [Dehalococcoidia bacterium]